MTTSTFSVTWDYRCPFARNAHEHLLVGLADGADWDVRYVPFSLGQVHVDEGATSVWDDPSKDSGLLALQTGVAVRDLFPDRFADVHLALFSARHDEARDVREESVITEILKEHDVDAVTVLDEVHSGRALATIREEHTAVAASHTVWGVPTFIAGDDAVFVRLMDRPGNDAALARRSIDRVVGLLEGWPELNEFKHTTRDR